MDLINYLPTELLYQVFEHLPFQDQLTAMTSCTRWHNILSDDRFTVRQTVDLGLYIRRCGDLSTLKGIYRSYKITQINACEVEQITKFLRSEEASERVEELKLDEDWAKPGYPGESLSYLPKLKKLWLRNWSKNVDKIVPLALEHVVLFEEPCITINDAEAFKNLHTLEIESNVILLRKPDYIYLDYPGVENLRILRVRGFEILYEHLQRLPQLRELYLSHDITVEDRDAANIIPITMPYLVKLTTRWTGVRLLRAPNLRSLTIIGFNRDVQCSSQVSKDLSAISKHRLTTLRLVQVNLSESSVNELCSNFSELMVLELDRVIVRHLHVDLILATLSNRKAFKRASFENCCFGLQDKNEAFYGSLARRYPCCVVQVDLSDPDLCIEHTVAEESEFDDMRWGKKNFYERRMQKKNFIIRKL